MTVAGHLARAVYSEWVKLRRRRFLYGSLIAIVGVVLLSTVVAIAGARRSPGAHGALTLVALGEPSGLARGLAGSDILLGAVALAIAAAQFGSEFAHGTLRNLLVREPRRTVLMAGKCLAVLSFLLVALAVASTVAIVAAFAAAHLRHVPTTGWTSGAGMSQLGVAIGDLAISVSGFAAVGMVLGVLLRSSVVAIATGLALLLPVETILVSAIPGTARWLPGQMLSAIAEGGTPSVPFAAALATVVAYLAVAIVATMTTFVRRDVTS